MKDKNHKNEMRKKEKEITKKKKTYQSKKKHGKEI